MSRLRVLLILIASALVLPACAAASTSSVQLWTALGNSVACGVEIHAPNSPPMQIICSARVIPAPSTGSNREGDPGFVTIASTGRPIRVRTSQDSFVGTTFVPLRAGTTWSIGPIKVTCKIAAKSIRCENHSQHGFTITKSSYHAF
jgi:hypothetical protein